MDLDTDNDEMVVRSSIDLTSIEELLEAAEIPHYTTIFYQGSS